MTTRQIIDRSVLIVIILSSTFLCIEAQEFPNKGGLFPTFSLISIILLSIFALSMDVLEEKKQRSKAEKKEAQTENVPLKRPMALFFLTAVQVFSMPLVGFYTSTAVFLVAVSYAIGLRQPRLVGTVTVVMMASFYIVFEMALKFEFPRGILI